MSKPDTASAKSLEEIIASIRKSLVGEGAGGSGARSAASARPAPVEPEPVRPVEAPDQGDGMLTDRLAGALNGAANGAALDDDLADILAHESIAPAPPKPAAAKAPDAGSGSREPSWLAGHAPAGKEAAPAPSLTPSLAPAVEAVKLSRPEVLRASLPPLFGEETEAASPARAAAQAPKTADIAVAKPSWSQPSPPAPAAGEAGKAAGFGIFASRTRPSVALPLPLPHSPDGVGKPATAGDARAAMPAPLQALAAATSAAPAGPIAAEVSPGEAVPQAPPATEAAPTLETVSVSAAELEPAAAPPAEAQPAARLDGEVRPDAAMNGAPTAHHVLPAAKSAPAVAPPARTLEQVVGELLEPVIRHWLESHLPRMVEKVVREEVARAIAAERTAPKAGG